jgi:hypothetical protein
MKYAPYSSTRRTAPAALLMLAALTGLHAAAQDLQDAPASTASQAGKPAASTTAAGEQSPIKINARKNPGDLSYKSFYGMQALIQSFQPPEPRMIDFSYRVSFMDLSLAERDAYAPESWAVAIVGDSFDQVVPVARGGYFVLPESPQAVQENATVMFNAQTRWRSLNVAFKLRVSPQQTLGYASFARAIQEFKTVQNQVPWYRVGLRAIRNARIDGLRACFGSPDARIEIDGAPARTQVEGMCQVLKFDPAAARAGTATIAFIGQLDNVTLHEPES